MISHKNKQRLDFVLNLALIALLMNIAIPVHANTVNQPTKLAGDTDSTQSPVPSLPIIPDKPVVVKKTITVRSSAYSSTKDQTDNDPFTTASGAKVHEGTIAMNGMPFGTKIRIPKYYGDKVFVVEDRMHKRWGNKKIDIWMPSKAEARQWGVRTVTIEII